MSEIRPAAFISHSSPDDGYVAELESFVRAMGYAEVFNDSRSIKPDEKFWPEIEKGITACDALIVVITPASLKSAWVQREVDLARSLTKTVVPVWIEDCELPPTFADRDVIDFRPKKRVKDRKIAPSRILRHSPAKLFGREKWLDELDHAWHSTDINLYTLVAWGGVGKTSLVAHWIAERLMKRGWPGVERYFDWSFYSQGTGESRQTSADLFINQASSSSATPTRPSATPGNTANASPASFANIAPCWSSTASNRCNIRPATSRAWPADSRTPASNPLCKASPPTTRACASSPRANI